MGSKKKVDLPPEVDEALTFTYKIKMLHKAVYRLAYIFNTDPVNGDEALKYINLLIEKGYINKDFVNKVMKDVMRWKKVRDRPKEVVEDDIYDRRGGVRGG